MTEDSKEPINYIVYTCDSALLMNADSANLVTHILLFFAQETNTEDIVDEQGAKAVCTYFCNLIRELLDLNISDYKILQKVKHNLLEWLRNVHTYSPLIISELDDYNQIITAKTWNIPDTLWMIQVLNSWIDMSRFLEKYSSVVLTGNNLQIVAEFASDSILGQALYLIARDTSPLDQYDDANVQKIADEVCEFARSQDFYKRFVNHIILNQLRKEYLEWSVAVVLDHPDVRFRYDDGKLSREKWPMQPQYWLDQVFLNWLEVAAGVRKPADY